MIEAVIAFLLSVLVIAVFGAPAWALKLATFGALGFVFWVLVLVAEWIMGRLKR
jgi:hypothetical protein